MSVLLEIPGYVDNFVKVCQAIREYKELDKSYRQLMDRATQNCNKLKFLVSLVSDTSGYSKETTDYITGLVRRAKLSMDQTSTVVDDWKHRLRLKDEETGSRVKRLIPSFSNCFWRRPGGETRDQLDEPSYLAERVAELEYMITGKLAIASAMDSLEHWLTDLNFAILTSNSLSFTAKSAEGTSENLEFVINARNRVTSNVPINFIDCHELEPFSDISSELETGIYSVSSGPYSRCIIDPRNVRYYTGNNKDDMAWQETKNIARLFAEANPHITSSVGILPSCGYTELSTHTHGIVFRLPPDVAQPRTLRSILMESEVKHPLHDRIQFSIKLATTVLVVHSLGLVHKNIKPDSILLLESIIGDAKDLYPWKLGAPHLLAFESSRSSTVTSMREPFSGPGGPLLKHLYVHLRHLVHEDRRYDYEMRDDIFGLGICLFEIALWKSLFRWDSQKGAFDVDKDVLDLSYTRCKMEARARGEPSNAYVVWLRRQILMQAAEDKIPPIMGGLFKDVVIECLTFGDLSKTMKNGPFQSEFNIKSNVHPDDQSVHFVRKILTKLRSIKLL